MPALVQNLNDEDVDLRQTCQLTCLKRVRPAFEYKTAWAACRLNTRLRADFDTFCSRHTFSSGQNCKNTDP